MKSGAGETSIHATVVAVGEAGVLIRGASGSGKSRLAQALIAEGAARGLFAMLVADDRAKLTAVSGRALARPLASNAGLIEERGTGLLKVEHEPAVVVRCVIDLDPPSPGESGDRLPEEADGRAELLGVSLPRLRLARDISPREGAARVLSRLERE